MQTLYEPGEYATLRASYYPGFITDPATNQRPAGVPTGTRLHILVLDRGILVGWKVNGQVGTIEFPGATAGDYKLETVPGCKCGASQVSTAVLLKGVRVVEPLRERGIRGREMTGLPSQRYTRTR